MRAIIQRVSSSSVKVKEQTIATIKEGLLIFVGIESSDNENDADWIASKIIHMRIFSDNADKMNLSVKDINGEILLVSQFTLHALTKKGNRPSFINAAKPEHAIPVYELLKSKLSTLSGKSIASGSFGANMQVIICNDGPVTIWLDSKNKV